MDKLTVINMFAGPGAGKSTVAAGVFSQLKQLGVNAELVTEFAKDLTWEKRHYTLRDQIYVFAKQQKRLNQLKGQVDVVVTDSPLLLSIIYNTDLNCLPPLVWECWEQYRNLNYLVVRDKEYNPAGRNQNEEEAMRLDTYINDLLDVSEVEYAQCKGNQAGIAQVISEYCRVHAVIPKPSS